MTVTNGKWCVSYTSGGDIPKNKIMFTPYYFEGEQIIKGEKYGQIMTRKEAEIFALKKGYLKVYKRC